MAQTTTIVVVTQDDRNGKYDGITDAARKHQLVKQLCDLLRRVSAGGCKPGATIAVTKAAGGATTFTF